MPFDFEPLSIPGVLLIEPRVVTDRRGSFMETYRRSEFAAVGIDETFVQENYSRSSGGVLRGLHYQRSPHAQSKLIRVVSGKVFDVAVDVRPDSPTSGRWVGVTLTSANPRMIYLPSWCAHGFCVLSESAEVMYLTSNEYAPNDEAGFMWNDPALGIDWPIQDPILAERDRTWPPFAAGQVTYGRSRDKA